MFNQFVCLLRQWMNWRGLGLSFGELRGGCLQTFPNIYISKKYIFINQTHTTRILPVLLSRMYDFSVLYVFVLGCSALQKTSVNMFLNLPEPERAMSIQLLPPTDVSRTMSIEAPRESPSFSPWPKRSNRPTGHWSFKTWGLVQPRPIDPRMRVHRSQRL